MKQALKVMIVALLGAGSLTAEEASKTKYVANLTGVVCGACKKSVTSSLQKLPGVVKVDFEKGEKADTQKATFESTSAALTKEQAIKALGDTAKEFVIVSLEKAK